jgi:hypothetical protein
VKTFAAEKTAARFLQEHFPNAYHKLIWVGSNGTIAAK